MEKHVHQDLDEKIGWNMYRAGMVMRREGARYLMRYKLTPEQWQIMIILLKKGALTQKALGDITLQDAPAVSRAVQRLIVKNYAKKTSSKKDKRAVLVELTVQGKDLLSQIMRTMKKHHTKSPYEGFSEVKKKQLVKLLVELRSTLENNIDTQNTGGEK